MCYTNRIFYLPLGISPTHTTIGIIKIRLSKYARLKIPTKLIHIKYLTENSLKLHPNYYINGKISSVVIRGETSVRQWVEQLIQPLRRAQVGCGSMPRHCDDPCLCRVSHLPQQVLLRLCWDIIKRLCSLKLIL